MTRDVRKRHERKRYVVDERKEKRRKEGGGGGKKKPQAMQRQLVERGTKPRKESSHNMGSLVSAACCPIRRFSDTIYNQAG